MQKTWNRVFLSLAGVAMGTALTAMAQSPAPAPAAPAAPAADAPTPLSTFVLTGPLQWLPPATLDAGPLGKVSVNGILSGYGQFQNNAVPGDDVKNATLTNGEIFIQKADGKYQYFVQAGTYALPSLGTPFIAADKTVSNFYGPVPVAFLKIPTGKNTSFQIGQLPTLMGAESTFSYQNFNVERGLLWNQENAINRGIQVNQTINKYLTASLSWNDGYYSDRYSWISSSVTFTKGPHSLVYDAMGNAGHTAYQTTATPVQNNSQMHVVIYTYTKGPWIVQPYYQYSNVPTDPKVGVTKGASTNSGALTVNRSFKCGFALPLRYEYIATSGNANNGAVNLLYGAGSSATSITATPTYQKGAFFVRGDVAWVHASDYTSGDVFGKNGNNNNQTRGVIEFGYIFGNNLSSK
ncbi:outer membrane beta-barrel protein [Telmatobacter bradus]|uniref:outer membrane beta-barrel protein n=1 Tax=Telmatobacter bradus TaxID=474953 RepID=UPI003B4336CA